MKTTLSVEPATLELPPSEMLIRPTAIEAAEPASEDKRARGVTPRVVLLSLLLAALFGYVIPIVDYKFTNTYLGAAHLPVGAVAVLFLLVAVINPVLRLLSRRRGGFSRNENLTIYITCLFSTLVPGRGAENFFVPNVIAAFYMATQSNRWLTFLQPYLKPWFTPALTHTGQNNVNVVTGWYMGGGDIPWGAWLVPLVAWASLIVALYLMLGCLSVILRAQWSQYEALTFPLLRLPVEMTDDSGSFFRNRLMWIGFGIAATIQLLNGLHTYFPDVPVVPLQINTKALFSDDPWRQLYPTTFLVQPIVVGLSYLLTTEISFSLWCFYWIAKFQLIIAYYIGFRPDAIPTPIWTRGWAKNFVAYQQVGAYIVYLGSILWIGRGHYGHVLRRALGRAKATSDESKEALPYPAAFWGFVLAFAFIVIWTAAAGVRLDIALALWLTYLMLALVLTRVVAEGGILLVQSGWAPLGPIAHLVGGGSGAWLSPASAVPAAFIQGALMTDMRGFLLPSFVQGFKLAHDHKIPMRRLSLLVAGAILVAMGIGWWNILRLGYRDVGGLALDNWWSRGNGATQPPQNAKEIIGGVQDSFFVNWFWLSVGGISTYLMMLARSRFTWFPLHPIGLIMCWPSAMYAMWFSIFIAWLSKVLILKYGGSDSYRRLIPLFLGVALGDIVMMIVWLIIDGWQGHTGHQLMPA